MILSSLDKVDVKTIMEVLETGQIDDSDELPTWYYTKKELKDTESAKDGISYDTECRYRRESARFIIKVGLEMKLRYDTMATGVVYMHRFYMCHSFKTFSRFVTACGCLFLAGKVEETPKKCKDIIKVAKSCMTDAQFTTFGEDPKETVMIMERILLQTLNFNLQVDHPYNHMLRYAKETWGDQGEIEKIVQMAWTFINDSLCTTICLQYEPEIVAIAAMFLAGKLSKNRTGQEITNQTGLNKWYDVYVENLSFDILEDICHQILDLYSMPSTPTEQTKESSPQPPPVVVHISSSSQEDVGSKIPVLTSSNGSIAAPIPVVSSRIDDKLEENGEAVPVVTQASHGSRSHSDFGGFVDQNMYMFQSNIGHGMPTGLQPPPPTSGLPWQPPPQ